MRRTFGETAGPAFEDNSVAAASDGTGEAGLLAGLTTEQVEIIPYLGPGGNPIIVLNHDSAFTSI